MSRFGGLLIFVFTLLIFQSCILKEFKGDKVHLKEDWDLEMMAPLFHGQFTFDELISSWDTLIVVNNEPVSILKFTPDSNITIPTYIIFEPSVIIEGFNFLIDGDDYIYSADLIYTVKNSSPFALNFQMRFYNKETPEEKGPAILPPPFQEGNNENGSFLPSESVYSLPLTMEQLESFKAGNRIEFSTWFEIPETDQHLDSLLATWPLEISVVFSGILHGEYE